MILDTTYLLPAATIDIDTDLLTLIYEGKINISLDQVRISNISLFELQAVLAKKYKMPPRIAINAIKGIVDRLEIASFSSSLVIEEADTLSKRLNDYIDCLILATAIALKDDLATEDSKILGIRKEIKESYGINVTCYKELLKTASN